MIEDVARLRLTVDSTGINEARAKLNTLGTSGKSSLDKVGAGATASRLAIGAMAIGVTAVGVTIAKTTAQWLKFNVAMKEVQTIAGVSGKEMDALRLKALRIAQALGVDATEAAQGFYQAISAGVPTDEVDRFVKVAAQLAQGGLADIGSSTDLLTTALNSYGKSASEAEKVSDQLFRTVKLGKTNIPQLAKSLARASATAATAGVSLEELLGITAATTKQGVKTAESFTQVKAAVVALLNPSETMAAIYQKLGVEGGRALIEQEGLAGALEQVRLAASGSDQVLVKALRSIEAYSLTAAITGAKLGETKKAIEDVGKASGDTAAASKIAGETLGTSFKKLGNSFLIFAENANQATGANEGLSGSISRLSDVISDPEIFSAYVEALQQFPAIVGRWIFLGESAEQQVKNFGKTLDEGALDLARYNAAIKDSADKRALRGAEQIVVAARVLNAEKALAMQREITEGLGGNEGLEKLDAQIAKVTETLKMGDLTLSQYKKKYEGFDDLVNKRGRLTKEIEATKQLEIQLGVYKRIGGAGGQIRQEQFKIAVEVERLNQLLRASKITTEEWKAETDKLKQSYGEVEGRVKAFGMLYANLFGDVVRYNAEAIKTGQRALELGAAQIRVDAILLENTDKNIALIEKKLTAFDDLLTQKEKLTAAEQAIKNLLENQLGILKQQTAEAGKSAALVSRESIRGQLATKEERASINYTNTVSEITKGQFEPEEEAVYLQRATDQFNKDIEPDKEKATSISSEEQDEERINAQVEMIGRQYATELELLAIHEEEKRLLIDQSTRLTHEQKNDLINKIDAEGVAARKAIAREELNQKLDATKQFLGGMSALAGAFGKKGFKAQQAFAIAEATVNTFQSATKAMATVPYPFNFIAAAGNIAYGLAQVAQIKSQQPPAYQQGGIVGGSSFGGDQLTGRVNSGEMILNKTQQRNLFAQANNPIAKGSSGGNVTIVNNAPVQLEAKSEQDEDGNFKIIVEQAVAQAKIELTNEAREGGGDFVPALETNYGLNRK